MALSLASISAEARNRAPRILLIGPPKVGKSEWGCGATFEHGKRTSIGMNSPIVLPVAGEEGVDGLPVPKFPTLGSLSEVLEAICVLYNEVHDHRTVVLDSASTLEPLIWAKIIKDAGASGINKGKKLGFGNGYRDAAKEFNKILLGLDALRNEKNMASVIIGHVKTKRFDDPTGDSYDRYQFDVHEYMSAMIQRWADVTVFANTKVVVKKEDLGFSKEKARGIGGGERFLFTQQRPAHPGGGRGIYGHLPYELPLSYDAFQSAVADAITAGAEQ